MGVKDLWAVLSPVGEVLPLSALEGKNIAVDLSCWVCEAQALKMGYIAKPHLRNLLFRTSTFLQLGILPIFVIEGTAPQLKWDTISTRNQRVWQGGKSATSSKTGNRSNFKSILKECKELLDLLGVPWVQAEGEAEATCAALNYEKIVDGVVTQDNDVFLYGAQVVYRNLSANQSKATVDRFDMKQIKEKLHLSRDSMVVMAILLGCDYLPTGIPGVGKEKALQLLRTWQQCDAIERLLSWTEEAKADESSDIHPKEGKEKFIVGVESKIRQKAIAVPGFPFPQIVVEYTKQRHVGMEDFSWRCPQMLKLVEWCVKKLDWVEDYAFEKIAPLVTRWQVNNIIPQAPSNKSLNKLQLQPLQIKKKCVNKGTASFVVEWKVCPSIAPSIPSSSHIFTTKEPNVKVQNALSSLLQEFEALHLKKKGTSKGKTKKDSSKGKSTVKTSETKKDSGKIDRYLSVNPNHSQIHSNPVLKTNLSSKRRPSEEWKYFDTSQIQGNLSLDDTDDADISLIVDRILGINIRDSKVQECDEHQNSVRNLGQRACSGSRYNSHSHFRNENKENIDYKPFMNTTRKLTKFGTVDSEIYLSSDDESERKPLSLKDVNKMCGSKVKEVKHSNNTVSSSDIEYPKFSFHRELLNKIDKVCNKEHKNKVCNVEYENRCSDIKHKNSGHSEYGEVSSYCDDDSFVDSTNIHHRNDIDRLGDKNDSENMATAIATCSTELRTKTDSEIEVNKGDVYQSPKRKATAPDTNVNVGDYLCSTLENSTLPLLDASSNMGDNTPIIPQSHLCLGKGSGNLQPERALSREASDGLLQDGCKSETTALSSQSNEPIEDNNFQISKDLFDDSDIEDMSKNMSLFNLCTSVGFEHTPQKQTAAPVEKHDTYVMSSENGSPVSSKNLAGDCSSYQVEMKWISPSRPVPYSPLVGYESCFLDHEGNVASTPKGGTNTDVPDFNLVGDCSLLIGQSVKNPHPDVDDGESVISENQNPNVSHLERKTKLNDTFSPVEVALPLAQRLKSRFRDNTYLKLIDKLQ